MGTAEEHGYMDVFTEADFEVTGNDPTPLALNNNVGINLGNLPKVNLTNGRFFYGYRIQAADLAKFQQLCKENNVQIVGKSWHEVWTTYPLRNDVFAVLVRRTIPTPYGIGGYGETQVAVQSIAVSGLRPGEQPLERIARPFGVWAGDVVPEFPLPDTNGSVDAIVTKVTEVRAAVKANNTLQDVQKAQINGYLDAIQAIATQPAPNRALLESIMGHLRKYALEALGYTARDEIRELLSGKLHELIDMLGPLGQ